jgi:dipeptidase E
MAEASTRALVVVNACDLFAEADRAPRVRQEVDALRGLGFEPEELDLRDYFEPDARGALTERLRGVGLVWIRGGNPFVLLRAMNRSGFTGLLRERLGADAFVCAGYSAGVCVLTPSLRGIDLVDDPVEVPVGYDPEPPWECLGVLDYFVAPHYRSQHPESAAIEKVVEYFIEHHMPFRALRDGEVILVDGNHEEILR